MHALPLDKSSGQHLALSRTLSIRHYLTSAAAEQDTMRVLSHCKGRCICQASCQPPGLSMQSQAAVLSHKGASAPQGSPARNRLPGTAQQRAWLWRHQRLCAAARQGPAG